MATRKIGVMMIDDVNFELQILADEAKLEKIQEQYDEMVEEMMFNHNMETYASNSYDLDAEFYGKGN